MNQVLQTNLSGIRTNLRTDSRARSLQRRLQLGSVTKVRIEESLTLIRRPSAHLIWVIGPRRRSQHKMTIHHPQIKIILSKRQRRVRQMLSRGTRKLLVRTSSKMSLTMKQQPQIKTSRTFTARLMSQIQMQRMLKNMALMLTIIKSFTDAFVAMLRIKFMKIALFLVD